VPSLCCFWCPASDFRDRTPGENCEQCGRAYELPLLRPPTQIGAFAITEPIRRGFYSAVYRARQESLGRTVVLKVVPVAVYRYFKKDWSTECKEHAQIAEGTPFVANITDQFATTVTIDGSDLECFVAVLENIPGPTLDQILRAPDQNLLTPRMAAQIAADLFEILHLFVRRERFHNDLHGDNIIVQPLAPTSFRSGAIDPGVRSVAIDLGSVLDADRSGDHAGRVLGDQHQIARHISHLASDRKSVV
jgi:serine/threonine protein kinase